MIENTKWSDYGESSLTIVSYILGRSKHNMEQVVEEKVQYERVENGQLFLAIIHCLMIGLTFNWGLGVTFLLLFSWAFIGGSYFLWKRQD